MDPVAMCKPSHYCKSYIAALRCTCTEMIAEKNSCLLIRTYSAFTGALLCYLCPQLHHLLLLTCSRGYWPQDHKLLWENTASSVRATLEELSAEVWKAPGCKTMWLPRYISLFCCFFCPSSCCFFCPSSCHLPLDHFITFFRHQTRWQVWKLSNYFCRF